MTWCCELESWSIQTSYHGIHPQRLKSRCCPQKKISPSVCCLRRQAMHSVPVTALELFHRHPRPFWDRSDWLPPGTFRQQLNSIIQLYNTILPNYNSNGGGIRQLQKFLPNLFFFAPWACRIQKNATNSLTSLTGPFWIFFFVSLFQFWRDPSRSCA